RSCAGKSRLIAALTDDDAALASGSDSVADEEVAAAWEVEIRDNTAALTLPTAVELTLLGKGDGIGGVGDKSNTHEGNEDQLVGNHLERAGVLSYIAHKNVGILFAVPRTIIGKNDRMTGNGENGKWVQADR
ncbi:hypothetical protein BGW38_006818, partial [Lunasporangiospora selenospora]